MPELAWLLEKIAELEARIAALEAQQRPVEAIGGYINMNGH